MSTTNHTTEQAHAGGGGKGRKGKEEEGEGTTYRVPQPPLAESCRIIPSARDLKAPIRTAWALPAWIAIAIACDAKEGSDHNDGAAIEVEMKDRSSFKTSAAFSPTAPNDSAQNGRKLAPSARASVVYFTSF